jgi:hypothetical protein
MNTWTEEQAMNSIANSALITFLMTATLTCFCTSNIKDEVWKYNAVNKGHAQYNNITGDFEWKEPCDTK